MNAGGAGGAMMQMSAVVLTCFLGAIPFFTVLNAWLVEKSMDTVVAVAVMLGIVFAIMAMMATWGTPLMFLVLAGLLGLNFGLPLLGTLAGRISDRRMTSEDIERFQSLIERDPRNAAAHSFLGDAYLRLGRFEEAANAYRTAVEIDPTHSQREKSQLQVALSRGTGPGDIPDICPGCHAEQRAGLIRCQECGHYMKMAYFFQDLSRQAAPAGGILLAGTLLATGVNSVWPSPANGFISLAALVAAGVVLWQKLKAA